MSPRTSFALASLTLLTATAHADLHTIFANEADFSAAVGGSLTQTNEFTVLETGNIMHPVAWTNGGLACLIVSDPPLSLYGLPGALSTASQTTKLVVNFTSGNVRAVGGLIYLTDADGGAVAGPVEVRVADGPTLILTNAVSPLPFTGVVSSGPLLTNLTLTSLDTNAFVTLDHWIVSEGQPWLTASRAADGGIRLTWPAPSTGYVLQSRGLSSGAAWQPVGGPAVRTNDFWRLSVPAPGEGALFRLRRP
jgi:hypothetical protein